MAELRDVEELLEAGVHVADAAQILPAQNKGRMMEKMSPLLDGVPRR